MKTILIFPLLIFIPVLLFSQKIKISGNVSDKKGKPVVFANVALKGFFDGSTTDDSGNFSFITSEKGKQTLSISSIGYETIEKEIIINDSALVIQVILKEKYNELDAVTIVAGTFEASDEKRAVVMRPLDIGSTAGAVGDISAAIEMLPGTQTIGESGGLFVRGGSDTESKTIIDEMVVQNPYYSSAPDIKQRGRFDPFMFSGTVFSSGGYSALYGQALSATLVLKSNGLADSTNTGGGLYAYGTNLFHVHRWDRTSLYVRGEYNNLETYHKTFKQLTDWQKSPENIGGKIIFRHKFSESDILKFYSNYSTTEMAVNYPELEKFNQDSFFSLTNKNLFINSSYKKFWDDEKWSLFLGTSFSNNNDVAFLNNTNMSEEEKLIQGKFIITNNSLSKATFHMGSEVQNRHSKGIQDGLKGNIDEIFYAGFLETDWTITRKFATRIGIRYEYSGLLNKGNFAPRTSLAYKTGEYSQISMAFGKFYQTPENTFLYYDKTLNFEKATHTIANYQWMKNRKTFRFEIFYKKYGQLIKNMAGQNYEYNNAGNGYAKGVELFFRDKNTIPNADFWVSYSFLDTKRNYRDYPISATPNFAAKHKVAIIYKHWVPKINTMLGFSYTFSTGRPYYNPNQVDEKFHSDYTDNYNNLDFNVSKIVTMLGRKTVIYASLQNVLGQEHIFGYNYLPNNEARIPIRASAIRAFFIGIFISTYDF